jgi:hypothetical protein
MILTIHLIITHKQTHGRHHSTLAGHGEKTKSTGMSLQLMLYRALIVALQRKFGRFIRH